MRRTLTTGLLFGILGLSVVARAQNTAEEHKAAGMAACFL